jgi:endonuclease/exonuclease/phosphatase family metal-dependent hydrolase
MKIFLAFLSLISFQMTFAQSLKVMTYNIRLDVAVDGVNQWPNRKEKVFDLLKKYDPDIIGVQEALHHQLQDILLALPNYKSAGVGRDDGKEKGEYSAILYKTDRLELISQETSWLSETPEVPGSKSWDAAITRVVTKAHFRDKKTMEEFIHFNTHFDHIGKEARLNSAKMIRQLIENRPKKLSALVTGDFNAEPTEPPYSEILLGKVVFDTRPEKISMGTFCNFKMNSQPCRLIDYIFYTKPWKVVKYEVIQDNDGIYYPSDHLPVMVEVK